MTMTVAEQFVNIVIDRFNGWRHWTLLGCVFALMWWLEYAVVVAVRQKVRLSYISITVWPRITTFYKNRHTGRIYKSTGQTVTVPFMSEVISVRKTAENDASTAPTYNHPNWHIHPYPRFEQPYRIWRHRLLPVGSYRISKNGQKYCLIRIQVEFLEKGLSDDHQISHSCRG